eukprot:364308-Chlamydomonas_euryale.AAC.16
MLRRQRRLVLTLVVQVMVRGHNRTPAAPGLARPLPLRYTASRVQERRHGRRGRCGMGAAAPSNKTCQYGCSKLDAAFDPNLGAGVKHESRPRPRAA